MKALTEDRPGVIISSCFVVRIRRNLSGSWQDAAPGARLASPFLGGRQNELKNARLSRPCQCSLVRWLRPCRLRGGRRPDPGRLRRARLKSARSSALALKRRSPAPAGPLPAGYRCPRLTSLPPAQGRASLWLPSLLRLPSPPARARAGQGLIGPEQAALEAPRARPGEEPLMSEAGGMRSTRRGQSGTRLSAAEGETRRLLAHRTRTAGRRISPM